MKRTKQIAARRARRHGRIRSTVSGTTDRPRLSVYKSSNAVYLQLIDDEKGVTLAASDSRKAEGKTPLEQAKSAGALLATKAGEKKIKQVVFDRGGYEYKGKIQAVAEGAREAGLVF